MKPQAKIVGKRKPGTGLSNAQGFLDLVVKLRGKKLFVPKGVFKFRTFKDAQDWMFQMMTREKK